MQCSGYAKSTNAQCSNKSKYNGYCHVHHAQDPTGEASRLFNAAQAQPFAARDAAITQQVEAGQAAKIDALKEKLAKRVAVNKETKKLAQTVKGVKEERDNLAEKLDAREEECQEMVALLQLMQSKFEELGITDYADEVQAFVDYYDYVE
ncbi:hypothetical protein CAOG_05706 [Capsaspora owczarzaki ATCC 30864]|uniref:Uncharacterized protein n=1 Tax=Capsaspora owczarzaki (strain ATCC 30864) TaxID=595528 RepID=A0A0D2WSM7_CAPO3|nr:hypothetical protein CAOG_05706 [Capsaspora owczarzaki ATCC 30864]KJE95230.1 hypothetical protein CAOG_005706 [Capsaspora owczarzaki ATCC 30864]|eukprot:XP_004346379.1 hypothetical protein CAOG_05706 [Capsaspora owczarzaki ATCC 30864]